VLSGRLDAYSVGPLWDQAHAALRAHPREPIVVDCSGVEYCDGAGVALLVDLLRQPRPRGAEVTIQGLADRFQRLLEQFDPKTLAAAPAPPRPRLPLLERVGRAGVQLADDLYAQIAFLGEAASAIGHVLRNPRALRWKDALYVAEEAGVNALPIVALIGFLMGVILAFQSAVALRQFGAGYSSPTSSRCRCSASSGR
jgi:phospholipid/cholesterol/gamma-HCH transport system permease protein